MRRTMYIFPWLLAACSQSSAAVDSSLTRADGPLAADATPLRSDAASSDAADAADSSDAVDLGPPLPTLLRVHYPAGAQKLTIRGSVPLSWTQGQALSSGSDDTWTFATSIRGIVEWKPLLDDKTWSLGPSYHVTAGQTLDVYPHFSVSQGQVQKLISGFASTILGNTRDIWAYLPPTYLENSAARMPVVYMHDGQNLFDAALAFGGNAWRADKTVDTAAASGSCPSGAACLKDSDCGSGRARCETFREAIIIGIANTADRLAEYTPVADASLGGGRGDRYLQMIVDELKPQVDTLLRTQPEPQHTAMIGSSLGGLISVHAGVTAASSFGLIGAMSPSTWWAEAAIIAEVKNSEGKNPRPLRVYLDSGDAGTDSDDLANTNLLAAAYLSLGFVEGQDFHHLVAHGHEHSESYWAQRLPGALAFLLGPR